jgi:hypothetical protein
MAETAKKSKVPAKPRNKATKADGVTTKITLAAPSQHEIAELAHRFWAERGFHHGSAEQDWLRAEEELRGKAS